MQANKLQSLLQAAIKHQQAGRLEQAEVSCRQARQLAPRNFDVLHLSGLVALLRQRFPEAVDLLSRALAMNPKAVACELQLAVALQGLRRHAEAETHFRRALVAQPDFAEGWDLLAGSLREQDKLGEAVVAHQRFAALRPQHAPGWVGFATTLRLFGKVNEALEANQRALALDPRLGPAIFGRAQCLQLLGRPAEAIAEYGRFLELHPQSTEARSNRLMAMLNLEHVTREERFAAHAEYGRVLGPAGRPAFPNSRDPNRRLKVAFLSSDLRTHSCAYFLEPILRHLDRSRFDVILYHDHFREDEVSARFRTYASLWRNFHGVGADEMEATVRADAPDILVEISGHTGVVNRLPVLNRRLAPVQISYLGYPDTTGTPGIDYRFTDAIADPVGEADAFATEKLVRFAPTAWAYQPPPEAPEVAPAPCLRTGRITFGCFNDPAKISDTVVGLWARILAAVPGSRLLLKGRGFGAGDARERFLQRAQALGLPLDRVELLERTPDTASHLARYHDVDVALDTFPYHGTTTTCEALWMGVPVVTLAGNMHLSRVGVSLLTAIGRPEWVANDAEGYVRVAVGLAAEAQVAAEARSRLRLDLSRSPVLDFSGQTQKFGVALVECWTSFVRS